MPETVPMQSYATLSLEQRGPHVLLVTLNRPAAANALNTQMGQDLVACFEALASIPASCALSC